MPKQCIIIANKYYYRKGIFMKQKILFLAALIIGLSTSVMSVDAAPKTMPDGTVFDAEYYAETYPDVATAIGTDETSLYNHYVQYGKAEGRKAVADTAKTTVDTAKASKQDNKSSANTTKAVKSSSQTVTTTASSETEGQLVWIPTKGGKKYHSKSSCSNMDNPNHVTIETAKAKGFTPCKKCYK